jgi:uncharacterized protein
MLKLTSDEQTWLDAFRRVLDKRFPGLVADLIIFGSKARGDARPDSDLDVLLVIGEGDWRVKDALALPGYDLAIGTDVVPSILVYTVDEWNWLREQKSVFREAVERDGLSVR